MRFKEFLFEFAFEQSKALEKIEEIIPQLSIHLAKCLAMPKSRDLNHWKTEIRSFIFKIDNFANIKTKSKRIKKKNCYAEFGYLFNDAKINQIISIIESDYSIELTRNEKIILSQKIKNGYEQFFDALEADKIEIENTFQIFGI
jgi:hypothetical protein